MLGERNWRDSTASVAAIVALTITILIIGAPGAHAAGGTASQLGAETNASRADAGLPGYAYMRDLSLVALGQAQRMADAGQIYHNPNLSTEVSGWRKSGENVGVGADPDQIHQAFMASPSHRANILSSTFTELGIATVVGGDGRLYVAEVFRLPEQQSQPADALAHEQQATPEPVSDPASQTSAPGAQVAAPSPSSPTPLALNIQVATRIASHPVVHRTSLVSREVRPQLVAPIITVPRTYRGLSRMVWLAALLAQAVLLAHMITFWRRYRIGSGS